jgi:hypothetical protein
MVPMSQSPLDRSMSLLRLDLSPTHRQPAPVRVLLAAILSVVGSLLADAALVAIGTRVFPATKGYGHFQLHDYATLTVIGVVIACAAWPVVVFRLAIAVTLVLLLPDLYILHQGQPARAVCFLMLMHLAIALITYNALVHLAPARRRRHAA